MRTIAALILLVGAALAPVGAHAYYLTCETSAQLILQGDDAQQGLAVGHSSGVVDVYAGLVCLTGGARCGCLSSLFFNRLDDFSEAFADELATCAVVTPDDPAFGPALRAAKRVCGG
jgi:hypothetical protein